MSSLRILRLILRLKLTMLRPLTPLLLTAALAAGASAAAPLPKPAAGGGTFVYVSVAGEKRIAVYRMDRATGKLTHRGRANAQESASHCSTRTYVTKDIADRQPLILM